MLVDIRGMDRAEATKDRLEWGWAEVQEEAVISLYLIRSDIQDVALALKPTVRVEPLGSLFPAANNPSLFAEV